MPRINLEHCHNLAPEEAQRRMQELMDRFSQKFGFSARWEQGTWARVTGRGIKGSVEVQPGMVLFDLSIPLILSPFKSKIEAGIRQQVSQTLG